MSACHLWPASHDGLYAETTWTRGCWLQVLCPAARGLQPAWDPAEMGLGATLPHSKMAVVRGQPPENEA